MSNGIEARIVGRSESKLEIIHGRVTMCSEDAVHDCPDMVAYERGGEGCHHHRGKSSERLIDKEAVMAALGIQSGQVILDAGCGNGYMSREFSGAVGAPGKVYALDPDEIAIKTLRRETEGTPIEPLVGDITKETFLAGSSCDLVYLCTVFHGFSDRQKTGFKTEVRRVLKPGGRLAVVEIVKTDTPFGPPLMMRYSPEELKSTLGLLPLATVSVGEYLYMQLFENR